MNYDALKNIALNVYARIGQSLPGFRARDGQARMILALIDTFARADFEALRNQAAKEPEGLWRPLDPEALSFGDLPEDFAPASFGWGQGAGASAFAEAIGQNEPDLSRINRAHDYTKPAAMDGIFAKIDPKILGMSGEQTYDSPLGGARPEDGRDAQKGAQDEKSGWRESLDESQVGSRGRNLGPSPEPNPSGESNPNGAGAEPERRAALLLAEGPTGIGKSFAYIIAGVICALYFRKKLIISSSTLTLQNQLFHKDLRDFKKISGLDFAYTQLKGRGNYLCPRKLKDRVVAGASGNLWDRLEDAQTAKELLRRDLAERDGAGESSGSGSGSVSGSGLGSGSGSLGARRLGGDGSAEPESDPEAKEPGFDGRLAPHESEFAKNERERKVFKIVKEKWDRREFDGDQDNLGMEMPQETWAKITSTSQDCLGQRCESKDDCPLRIARERAKSADVVVVNHALLLTDAMLGLGTLLPDPLRAFYCIDEAHKLRDVAMSQFTSAHTISRARDFVEEANDSGDVIAAAQRADLGSRLKEYSTLASRNMDEWEQYLKSFEPLMTEQELDQQARQRMEGTMLSPLAREAEKAMSRFERESSDKALASLAPDLGPKRKSGRAGKPWRGRESTSVPSSDVTKIPAWVWLSDFEPDSGMRDLIHQSRKIFGSLQGVMLEIGEALEKQRDQEAEQDGQPDPQTEDALRKGAYLLREATEFNDVWAYFEKKMNEPRREAKLPRIPSDGAIDALYADNPMVAWIRRTDDDFEFRACPVSMAGKFDKLLWGKIAAACLTSATLRSLGRYDQIEQDLGLGLSSETRTLTLASPFPLKDVKMWVVKLDNAPPKASADSARKAAALIERCAKTDDPAYAYGHLAIFTSIEHMKAVRDALPFRLREAVLMQGEARKKDLIEAHKKRIDGGRASLLFGVDSFAEGLDLPGKYCMQLFLAKLPFAPPDDPFMRVMDEWLKARGKSSFDLIQLPRCSIKLIQACGRLIRAETDTGRIVMLDHRILTMAYGKRLAAALPYQMVRLR